MLRFIKEKIKRHVEKRTFSSYNHSLLTFDLPTEGRINYARWLHPTYRSGTIDQSLVDFFKQYIKQGSFAIDIGAHEGDTTVPMALAAGKNGLILALEPNPHVFSVLEKNSRLNPDKYNIIPLNVAATASDGEFEFGSGDASYGNGGLIGFSSNSKSNIKYTQKVTGINLVDYLNNNFETKLTQLSFIKTDVEGYDKEIIKSLLPILKKYRPIVICEVFKLLSKEERSELYNLFHDVDYVINRLPNFEGSQPEVIKVDDMLNWKHFDIICFPK